MAAPTVDSYSAKRTTAGTSDSWTHAPVTGCKGIAIYVVDDTWGDAIDASFTYGGLALTAGPEYHRSGSLPNSSHRLYYALDVTGRADDTVAASFTNPGGHTFAYGSMLIDAAAALYIEDVGDVQDFNSLADAEHTLDTNAATGDTLVVAGSVGRSIAGDTAVFLDTPDGSVWTYTANRSHSFGWWDDMSDGDTFNADGGSANAVESLLWLALSGNPNVTFHAEPFGAEAGFQADITFELGAAVMLIAVRFGAEAGWATGLRFRSVGARQVMLTGAGIETPEMTEGGTEGQVLTFHADDKPSWEDGGGPGTTDFTSLLIDTSVSGSVTVDRDDAATHDLTLTGDATLTPDHTDPVTGDAIDLRIIIRQDGTGGHTLAWGGTITWAGGSAPTMPTDPNALLTVGLLSVDDASTWLGYVASNDAPAVTLSETVTDETTWGITPDAGTSEEAARGDHTHGTPAEPAGTVTVAAILALGFVGPIVMVDGITDPPEPLTTEDGSDFVYSDL